MNYLTRIAQGFGWGATEAEAPTHDEEDLVDLDAEAEQVGVAGGERVLWDGAASLHSKDPVDGTYHLHQERVVVKITEYDTSAAEQAAREAAEGGEEEDGVAGELPPKYFIEFLTPREGKVVLRSPVGDALEVSFHRGSNALMFDAQLQDMTIVSWAAQLLEPHAGMTLEATMDSFINTYNEANYKSYIRDVPDDVSVPSNPVDCDMWSSGGGDVAGEDVLEDDTPAPAGDAGDDEEEDNVAGDLCADQRADSSPLEMDLDVYEDTSYEEGAGGVAMAAVGAATDVNLMMADNTEDARLLVLKRRKVDGKQTSVLGVCGYEHGGFRPEGQQEHAGFTWRDQQVHASEVCTLQAHQPLLLDPDAPTGGVYQSDLETGRIVANYRPTGEAQELCIDHILPTDPAGDRNLVTCLTANNVFAMDLRLDPSKAGIENYGSSLCKNIHDWAVDINSRNKYFSCHATSADGKLAVGNMAGEIRFYSGTPGMPKARTRGQHPKKAKTLLKGNGHPVRFLDISQDGEWLIATYDKFLMLIRTTFEDAKGQQASGFAKGMGKNKPTPIRLTLDFAKMRGMGAAAVFRKAKFEVGVGGQESRIVAAIGNTMVSWNLNNIKRDAAAGRQAMATRSEARSLVDISALASSEGHTVKYLTEDSIMMAKPQTTRTSVRRNRFVSDGLAYKR